MLSLNLFKKSARRSDDSARCRHQFANGGRCRNPIAHDSPGLCAFHRGQLDNSRAKAGVAATLRDLYGQFAQLDSEAAIAHVLSNLFRLIAENRIPRRRAALLASTARAVLRALKDNRHVQRNDSPTNDAPNDAFNHNSISVPDSTLTSERAANLVGAELAPPAVSRAITTPPPQINSPHQSQGVLWLGHNLTQPHLSSPNFFTQPPIIYESSSLPGAPEAAVASGCRGNTTASAVIPRQSHQGLPRDLNQKTSTATPNSAAANQPADPAIGYTYQQALAETQRLARLIPGNDVPEFKSDDIAIHNGDVNRKKWDGGPIKFSGLSVKEFRRKWRRGGR